MHALAHRLDDPREQEKLGRRNLVVVARRRVRVCRDDHLLPQPIDALLVQLRAQVLLLLLALLALRFLLLVLVRVDDVVETVLQSLALA